MDMFQPMTEDLIEGLTTELTRDDVLNDENWTTSATCLTATNLDRSVINNITAQIYGTKKGQVVVRWRRQFRGKAFDGSVKVFMETMLYSEDCYPELFGFFVYGAAAQILDNGNGNVCYGVANGTPCKMIGLGWDDAEKEKAMHELTYSCRRKAECLERRNKKDVVAVVDLPYPPDCIIVEVKVPNASNWPTHLNLSDDPERVWIPIGLKTNRGGNEKDCITLSNGLKLPYLSHAVDLAFAITTWKSQGGTFEYVVALLESFGASHRQKLSFELLYVMFSRVKKASGFRCFPLSAPKELRKRLRSLYPNIFATRYRMDVKNIEGRWDSTKSQQQAQTQPKSKRHRNQPIASATQQYLKKVRKEAKSLQKQPSPLKDDGPKESHLALATPTPKELPSSFPTSTSLDSPIDLEATATNDDNNFTNTQQPSHWVRQMSQGTGLPLTDSRFSELVYSERGLDSLQPGVWATDEAVDLLSILELQDSEEVYYIPSNHYSHYFTQIGQDIENPILISERTHHQPDERRRIMRSRKMWIATVCDNHHWQALCIINPGTEYCIAMLLDSLVTDENDTPSNYGKCQKFATAFVNAVYEDDNMSNREAVMMHIGLVPKQPNYNDCGVFASLNVQNAASRVGELTSYGLLPTCHNYRDWYTVADGVNFRNSLRNHYQDLLDIHGEFVPFYGTVSNSIY
jgi:hypothetical protein